MSADIEHRRRAIARAFREARVSHAGTEIVPRQAEPPAELTQRLQDVEHAIAEIRQEVAGAVSRLEGLSVSEGLNVEPAEAPEATGEEPTTGRPSVPPLESAGLMSPVASRALFGHS